MIATPSPADTQARLTQLQASLRTVADELLTPALVVDLGAVDHNIAVVLGKAGGARRWRPHIKTLKQSQLVRSLMRQGISSIKCATLDELALALDVAEREHPEGHIDVLVAYALSRNAVRAAVELGRDYEGGTIRFLADSPEHLRALGDWIDVSGGRRKFTAMLDVDVGMHRTGTSAADWQAAKAELDKLEGVKKLEIVGLHGYEGQLGWDEGEAAAVQYDALVGLAKALGPKAIKWIITSGSHAFLHAIEHPGLRGGPWIHQVSPGTLVLSDRRSSAPAEALGLRQAVFVVSRVISTPGSDRITLDAGSKAIAPDCAAPACSIVGWPQLEPLTPSEEHRPVQIHGQARPSLGELLWLVPDHACTTVNLHRQVVYVRDGELVARGRVEAMSRSLWVADRRP